MTGDASAKPPRRCRRKQDRQSVSRREVLGKKHINPHNQPMRQIGNRTQSRPGLNPSAHSLRLAGVHQSTGQALAALATTGVAKGTYRFATHAEMNRHSEDALARAIAANVRQRTVQEGRR